MAGFGRTKVVYNVETAVDLLALLSGLETAILDAARARLRPPRWRGLQVFYSPRVQQLSPGLFQIWPKFSIHADDALYDDQRADDLDLLSDDIEAIMDDELDLIGAVVKEKKVSGHNRPNKEIVSG